MADEHAVAIHYKRDDLLDTIRKGLAKMGKPDGKISVDDLAAVDEFHIGGRRASEHLHDQLGWRSDQQLLDIGCGLGGTARFAATRYGARVTGIDLTPEYVHVGNALNALVSLDDRVELVRGSALALPFRDACFDGAYLMHVGMNIDDKARLFAQTRRVLRPGATFGIYEVMQTDERQPEFPLPWATSADQSALASTDTYREALTSAGFTVEVENDRSGFAQAFLENLNATMSSRSGPPPLGLHLLMGPSAGAKIANMLAAIRNRVIAPVEMISRC
ncbi:MAG: class I SAM-dependent methyltransferase [Burkholderiaceae bacterium]